MELLFIYPEGLSVSFANDCSQGRTGTKQVIVSALQICFCLQTKRAYQKKKYPSTPSLINTYSKLEKYRITVVLQIMDLLVFLGTPWARHGVSTSWTPRAVQKHTAETALWVTLMVLTTASISCTPDCRIRVGDELFPTLLKAEGQPRQTKHGTPFSLKQGRLGFHFFLCCCVRQSITCSSIYYSVCQTISVFNKFWAALLTFMPQSENVIIEQSA